MQGFPKNIMVISTHTGLTLWLHSRKLQSTVKQYKTEHFFPLELIFNSCCDMYRQAAGRHGTNSLSVHTQLQWS